MSKRKKNLRVTREKKISILTIGGGEAKMAEE